MKLERFIKSNVGKAFILKIMKKMVLVSFAFDDFGFYSNFFIIVSITEKLQSEILACK